MERNLSASDQGDRRHLIEQAFVPRGSFLMGDSTGDANPGDGEEPQHRVTIQAFSIDTTAVTNDDFARFVEATGYRTEAESFGYSAVFHLALSASPEDIMGVPASTPWWVGVKGADWRHPGGRHSSIDHLPDHPVVHISWNDAAEYCRWANRRPPTEAEWEYASRGGLAGAKYPWGRTNLIKRHGERTFGRANFLGRTPVTTAISQHLPFAPMLPTDTDFGRASETSGNGAPTGTAPPTTLARARWPPGPESGTARVLRGGSFLCHPSYCNRYRNSARSHNTPDSSMGNAGFRTVNRCLE